LPCHHAWCGKELAHIRCDHLTGARVGEDLHRGRAETEAESVAHIVCNALGLDSAPYSDAYVMGWADGDMDLVQQCAETVLRAAKQILTDLTPDRADADTDADPGADDLAEPADPRGRHGDRRVLTSRPRRGRHPTQHQPSRAQRCGPAGLSHAHPFRRATTPPPRRWRCCRAPTSRSRKGATDENHSSAGAAVRPQRRGMCALSVASPKPTPTTTSPRSWTTPSPTAPSPPRSTRRCRCYAATSPHTLDEPDSTTRDELLRRLRESRDADQDQALLDAIREHLATNRRELGRRRPRWVIFGTMEWDNGHFLTGTTATVCFASGDHVPVDFHGSGVDELLTDMYGACGPMAALGVDLRNASLEFDDYADNVPDLLGIPAANHQRG
jgi:hypothetical protein